MGNAAYSGQHKVIEQLAPCAQDLTQRRGRAYKYLSQLQRQLNRQRSRTRARVEHIIGVIKRIIGLAKVRYRGIAKNGIRRFVVAALTTCTRSGSHYWMLWGLSCARTGAESARLRRDLANGLFIGKSGQLLTRVRASANPRLIRPSLVDVCSVLRRAPEENRFTAPRIARPTAQCLRRCESR